MSSVAERLDRLGPTIEKLMSIGGTPGLSLGVITKDGPVYYKGYGYRNVETKLPVTKDTTFPICSLTKAMTTACLGLLVEEGKLTWDTLVKDVLPTCDFTDPTLQESATVADILSHRTGMGEAFHLIIGSDGNVHLPSKDVTKFINHQPTVSPFRSQFGYCNLHYELAGRIIEHLRGESYFDFVKSRILEPLEMNDTYLQTPPDDVDDLAVCYNALDDASTVPIRAPTMGDDWYGAPSGGTRSTVSDMLKLYGSIIRSYKDQSKTGTTSSEGSILKQLPQIMSPRIDVNPQTERGAQYAFGWARAELPARLGQVGLNTWLLPNGMPLVGEGTSNLLLFHHGSLPGSLAYVGLLPEIEAAIVVLTNSLALTDVPDWVGQLVIEELLGVAPDLRNDYVRLAQVAVAKNLEWHPSIVNELECSRKTDTYARPLEQYVGTYWDDLNIFKIEVRIEGGSLYWLIQGVETEKFLLRHYQDDTFTWLLPRNELSKRGRWVGQDVSFWKVEFGFGDSGTIERLHWTHTPGVPAMVFRKIER